MAYKNGFSRAGQKELMTRVGKIKWRENTFGFAIYCVEISMIQKICAKK